MFLLANVFERKFLIGDQKIPGRGITDSRCRVCTFSKSGPAHPEWFTLHFVLTMVPPYKHNKGRYVDGLMHFILCPFRPTIKIDAILSKNIRDLSGVWAWVHWVCMWPTPDTGTLFFQHFFVPWPLLLYKQDVGVSIRYKQDAGGVSITVIVRSRKLLAM